MNIIEGLRTISGRITTILPYLHREGENESLLCIKTRCVVAHNDDTEEMVESGKTLKLFGSVQVVNA